MSGERPPAGTPSDPRAPRGLDELRPLIEVSDAIATRRPALFSERDLREMVGTCDVAQHLLGEGVKTQLESELFGHEKGAFTVRKEEVAGGPTLGRFASRFLERYAKANRQKPSGIAGKETILRVHLVPHLGDKPLDTMATEDVQRLTVLKGSSRGEIVEAAGTLRRGPAQRSLGLVLL